MPVVLLALFPVELAAISPSSESESVLMMRCLFRAGFGLVVAFGLEVPVLANVVDAEPWLPLKAMLCLLVAALVQRLQITLLFTSLRPGSR